MEKFGAAIGDRFIVVTGNDGNWKAEVDPTLGLIVVMGLRELQKCKNGVLGPITGLGWINGDANLGLGIRALNDDEKIDDVIVFMSLNDKGPGFGLVILLDVAIETLKLPLSLDMSIRSLLNEVDKLTGDGDMDDDVTCVSVVDVFPTSMTVWGIGLGVVVSGSSCLIQDKFDVWLECNAWLADDFNSMALYDAKWG